MLIQLRHPGGGEKRGEERESGRIFVSTPAVKEGGERRLMSGYTI